MESVKTKRSWILWSRFSFKTFWHYFVSRSFGSTRLFFLSKQIDWHPLSRQNVRCESRLAALSELGPFFRLSKLGCTVCKHIYPSLLWDPIAISLPGGSLSNGHPSLAYLAAALAVKELHWGCFEALSPPCLVVACVVVTVVKAVS